MTLDFEKYREEVLSSDPVVRVAGVEALREVVELDPSVAGSVAVLLGVALDEGLDRLVQEEEGVECVDELSRETVRDDEMVWKALTGLAEVAEHDMEAVKGVVDGSTVDFFIDACFDD